MIRELGMTQVEVAKRLSIPSGSVARWAVQANKGEQQHQGHDRLDEQTVELAQLRKENAELRMEREILKKAAAYFAKESLPGTRS